MNVPDRQLRAGKNPVGFVEQITNFVLARCCVRRVPVIPDVSGADQILLIPRNNEERPAVCFSLDIECVIRCAVEVTNNDVTAFRAAHHPGNFPIDGREHAVDPRASGVNNQPGCYFFFPLACLLQVLNAFYNAVADGDPDCRAVISHLGASLLRTDNIFQDQPLGESDLRIVVLRTTQQSLLPDSRFFRDELLAAQHPVRRNIFADG